MESPETFSAAEWAASMWAANLASAVEAMTGERPQATCVAAERSSMPEAGLLWWEQPVSLAPDAVLWMGAPEASWLGIGRHTLASAGIESTEPSDARSTFLEVANQAFSGLCQAISERVGSTISCLRGTDAAGPGSGGTLFEIQLSLGEQPQLTLYFALSAGLLRPLESGQAAAFGPGKAVLPPQPEPPQNGRVAPNTLDLLMEVDLPVSVSFGRADLPLKDVIKLTTGSIVELNRAISEPVEVIVNNCVVARGEVVVVEGNYGVRIQEIISRDKRLRTLK